MFHTQLQAALLQCSVIAMVEALLQNKKNPGTNIQCNASAHKWINVCPQHNGQGRWIIVCFYITGIKFKFAKALFTYLCTVLFLSLYLILIVLFVQIFRDMPNSSLSNTQLKTPRRRSTDSKTPSCSERPLTLFHTPTHSHKGKLKDMTSCKWFIFIFCRISLFHFWFFLKASVCLH